MDPVTQLDAAVMRQAGERPAGLRFRGLAAILWRAGLQFRRLARRAGVRRRFAPHQLRHAHAGSRSAGDPSPDPTRFRGGRSSAWLAHSHRDRW